ncbi:xanthine dehydrogenase family protein molybdopterin-binding subunit [Plastoroseomonas hellenica]|uniref:Xanthine dehydrogenase family protein molybdopterin-binding subunit n=1 Tax=Plastoroseomonas hellenica TaxID=2687306 RepID=A0ABS5EXU8_9PROT|nr:xanthine dehydrogenase family protein molybdopterin-binding subunit [Plastoroseomonas hellenica]MBR0643123.1 xanthine dehydrogenase family protein molybdopterin-binding subunit [Plastoroseomonas hellenica]MBR0665125.1 xanthine dehydrogenase family protein molybdopterin-binding subunit [Plastoroseomonas hellenica]
MNVISNKWIGQRTIRPDGADKVTGRAAYGADTVMPGMIWARVLRSPHAHARILRIDTSKAEALPGVKAVMTAKDVVEFPLDKSVMLGIQDMRWMCRNVMAREKALFHGHPVAAVAATTEAIAAEACALIEVEYEVLPWVIEIEDAIKPDAPILHDFIKLDGKPSNIAGKLEHKLGDVDAGFAQADVVIEREFKTRPVHQGYIESHACLVSVSPDGKATIWSSSQGQFMVRAMSAYLTGIPQSDIRAIPAEIGGGFGGKTIIYLEPLALILARKSGRPVKMIMSREEVFRASGPTSGSMSKVKIGATKDGKIVAAQGTFYLQAGALPGSPIRGAAGCAFAPYDIPNVHSLGFDVVSNRSKVAAYRAPGAPIGAYAVECVVDEIAEALKMDPLELRLKNAAKQGTKAAHGPVYPRIGFVETIEAALAHPHYKAPLGKHQGRGVASGFWFNAGGESSAQVNVTEDGNVVVTTGHPDIGGSRASTANITAELLGIDYKRVSVLIGDTATIGYSNLTGGSRVTFASAMVVTQSTEKVITTLRERAAKIWKIDPEAVTWDDGEARPAGDNAGKFPALTLAEIAAKASETGGPIGAGVQLNTAGAEGGFATHVCDVEVDLDLGIVRVLRYTSFQDVGRAIHPSYVEGQMQGGAAQGIGWALSEEYIYDKKGRVDNASFLDYRMPVCSDLPMLDTVIIEVPNPKHPQGVRGVGEVPLVPPLAAVSNAVYNALGRRFYSLPMSPPRVLEVLEGA